MRHDGGVRDFIIKTSPELEATDMESVIAGDERRPFVATFRIIKV